MNLLGAYSRAEVDLEEACFRVQCQQWFLEVRFADFFKPLSPLQEHLLIVLVQNLKKVLTLVEHILCLGTIQRPRREKERESITEQTNLSVIWNFLHCGCQKNLFVYNQSTYYLLSRIPDTRISGVSESSYMWGSWQRLLL